MSHVDDGTLHAYLDGELSPAEAQGMDAHLAQCPGCRGRLDEERALIARADELLALATPPDRAVPPPFPPFRPGDFTPPLRLWWHVRLPLAWAATVALALGIGWYVGGEGLFVRSRPQPPEAATEARALEPIASEAEARARKAPRPWQAAARPAAREAETAAPQAVAGAAVPPPAPEVVAMERAARDSLVAMPTAGAPAPAVSVAPRRSLVAGDAKRAARPPLSPLTPITLDSARRLLDQDPLALPGVPIRAVHRERALGEIVIRVEQVLDSITVIELRERRSETPLMFGEVVVAGAPAPSVRQNAAADRADTPSAPPSLRPEAQIVEERGRAVLQAGAVSVEISGPLPADSLRRLLERLRPVKP